MNNSKLAAIILAAGKGKRMKSKGFNKVTIQLGNKPMILHGVELLKELKVNPIIVVVGYAKNSVIKLLDGQIVFTEQKKRLGTAHAVKCALKKIPQESSDVLIIQGDDSAFYTKNIIIDLVNKHIALKSLITLLTIKLENPFGLGRIIRNNKGEIIAIIEEKDATLEQKQIKEVNPACYVFNVNFLKKYINKVKKSLVTGEYYLTSLIDLAFKNNEKVESLSAGFIPWRGVNTKEELEEAEKLLINQVISYEK